MNLRPFAFYIILAIAVLLYFGGRYVYFLPKYGSGEMAPDFSAVLIDGSEFSLGALRGDFVLLDFWGSWCGPCRAENPEIVALYQRHRQSGGGKALRIVNVGVEYSEQNWKRAIERDGLDWPYHIGQFDQFDSPIPEAYGVREIPTKFLIGPDGYILAVNPSITEIENILADNS